ncbi:MULTISPECIES: exonuclease SbcCD subunit D [unclassified Streptomyces]|uniref:exonuclease SbcCD subunit D n=1 Tax=unclassified Streptomyces TaxID=2593676 RepID=UPI0006FAF6EE|nr:MULTISPECIES: exonuclease SbcCD subunit D [unclassified Streptomyces]KQX57425.1 DNA exonuclease SbcCD subunit SbcD [Streptomyces sp. Root1304]KRA98797.1 DNA exonuclease SbcCD subunit SbcD [Streptomyces sp. Root66D1]
MRLLHTSDWHLGRSFHRVGLLDAQAAFLDHLVATVHAHEVDAVLVAGDVYDRAVPPLTAVELFDTALHRLAEAGVPTVMISGNHDSARRLGVGAGLIGRAGIHLRTDPAGIGTPVVLTDAHGDVAVYGLPYLEPALVREQLGAPKAGHEAVLAAAMDRVRADLAARPPGTRSVVLAHAFVAGGAPSDSERDITVGGVAAVPTGVFDGVDYVALGHLHGSQTLTPRVRYSGSPLAYSFSETDHRKTMWLIDLGPADGPDAPGADGGPEGGATGAITRAERLDCPVPRPLARIRGHLDDLLADPELTPHEESWVEATLTDPLRPAEPMARLAERFPHTLHLVFDPERADDAPGASYASRLRDRTDQQIAEDFVAHVRGGASLDGPERAVLYGAFDDVRVDAAEREVDR